MSEDFIPCHIKMLPESTWLAAAKDAVQHNPANAPNLRGLAMAQDVVLEPQHLALLTSKYWGSGGVRLTVGFLSNISSTQADRILSHMNAWGTRANVTFTRASASPQVRIAFQRGGGFWSYLGTDILHVNGPTMNLEGFDGNQWPESEYHRVIRHETGHTLGFPHEHLRKSLVSRLDVAKTLNYFERTQGWSAQEVQAQVLTPLNEADLIATPADQDSILCYQLPGSITTDGQPIRGGTDINETDYGLAAKLYPKAVIPPPPPPPPPPPSGGDVVVSASDPSSLTALQVFLAGRTLTLKP